MIDVLVALAVFLALVLARRWLVREADADPRWHAADKFSTPKE